MLWKRATSAAERFAPKTRTTALISNIFLTKSVFLHEATEYVGIDVVKTRKIKNVHKCLKTLFWNLN